MDPKQQKALLQGVRSSLLTVSEDTAHVSLLLAYIMRSVEHTVLPVACSTIPDSELTC